MTRSRKKGTRKSRNPNKQKTKKRPPAHKRIPPEHGILTRSARKLYDLIFWFGLGGCWMSNKTIARKIGYCKRTIQRARQELYKKEVVIIARTNPHTWIMWSRFHGGVQKTQVLSYPTRRQMDNPYFALASNGSGVTNAVPWGDKMSPKSDVCVLPHTDTDVKKKEPPAKPAEESQSRRVCDPHEPPAQSRFATHSTKKKNKDKEDKTTRYGRPLPELNDIEWLLYGQYVDMEIDRGLTPALAQEIAKDKIKKHQAKKN